MRGSLLWKLLAVNAVMLGVVLLAVWIAIDYLAADYFSTLMDQYNISPAESHQMFVDAVHRYLIQACLIALALAGGLSFLLTRKVLRPLQRMTDITRRVASGDYSARVQIASDDEIGRLAEAFDRMADSLAEMERLRHAMVADMAHELRTPMTNLRGYFEALVDGVVPPTRETFELLERETLRLVRLIDDLQQLTKADAARAYLRREDVLLADLVRQVVALYRPQFQSRCIDVDVALDENATRVSGDPDKLLQVFRNLIENACRYTPVGGRFRIRSAREPEGLMLSFANSGEPIPATSLETVFERFRRGDASRSRESGGSGIGLAIVKQLVEAHGGRVDADTTDGLNTFRILLPA